MIQFTRPKPQPTEESVTVRVRSAARPWLPPMGGRSPRWLITPANSQGRFIGPPRFGNGYGAVDSIEILCKMTMLGGFGFEGGEVPPQVYVVQIDGVNTINRYYMIEVTVDGVRVDAGRF